MGKSGYDLIKEGKARIAVPWAGKVSSRMPVFYNPVMKSNRDITLALMDAAAKLYGMKKWRIAEPMAATGVRGIRMLLELKNIESVNMNDYSTAAAALIKKNLRLNRVKRKFVVTVNEAGKFMLTSKPFNYIDIDPFGYPGSFLDAAIKRLAHKGIIAVTATDTSALSGTAENACRRKYLATPLRNGFMHETGIRILVRLAQLIGAMHEKALTPIFSYSMEHYMRAFLYCKEGAGRADGILRQHKEIYYCGSCCEKRIGRGTNCGCGRKMSKAGPLWAGKLFDAQLAEAMAAAAGNKNAGEKSAAFLKIAAEEAKNEGKTGAGFFAIEDICEQHHIPLQPATQRLILALKKKGYAASRTHCSATGVKTNAPISEVVAAAKVFSLNKKFKLAGNGDN